MAGDRDDDGNPNNSSIFFWGVDGEWIGTYQFQTVHPTQAYPVLLSSQQNVYTYFAGRRVAINGVAFAQDRLGTSVKTYPFGEEKTPNGQDGFKFATYYRETGTNLDYAEGQPQLA